MSRLKQATAQQRWDRGGLLFNQGLGLGGRVWGQGLRSKTAQSTVGWRLDTGFFRCRAWVGHVGELWGYMCGIARASLLFSFTNLVGEGLPQPALQQAAAHLRLAPIGRGCGWVKGQGERQGWGGSGWRR